MTSLFLFASLMHYTCSRSDRMQSLKSAMLARSNVLIFHLVIFFFLVNVIHVEGNSSFVPLRFRREHASDAPFGYDDTQEWGKDNPACWGQHQSPINVVTSDLNYLPRPQRFIWHGWERTPTKMTLKNNGHTVQLSAIWDDDGPPSIFGGILGGEYRFVQLHFHWGHSNDFGSEHKIDGRTFPLEMHMVHYKKMYGSVSDALQYKDGLAVVGVFFELSDNNNPGISQLENYMSSIQSPMSEVEINPFPLSKFDVEFQEGYATYSGSLTTPPCAETVKWILWSQTREMNDQQMKFFRSIQLANGNDHNYRPTKLLNGRIVDYVKNY